MATTLGPFKRAVNILLPGAFIITGFDAALTKGGFDYTWGYADNGGPSSEDCYKTNSIPYSGNYPDSAYTCIELVSGDIIDFDSGTWTGPFGPYYQAVKTVNGNSFIFTIEDKTGSAIYYLTRNGWNQYSKANMCSDYGLSDCEFQNCRKITCP